MACGLQLLLTTLHVDTLLLGKPLVTIRFFGWMFLMILLWATTFHSLPPFKIVACLFDSTAVGKYLKHYKNLEDSK
jgi:hypothetical protein